MATEQSESGGAPGRATADGRTAHAAGLVEVDRAEPAAEQTARDRASHLLSSTLPYLAYVAAAVYLLNGLWRDPGGRMLQDNYQDQVFFEWLLTNGANTFSTGDNPLFSTKINAPYGLNLMANTSVLALALPLAPITMIFGADVTFVLITTLALAGTASAWYFVLNRLLHHRAAAVVGGAFCGFAPAMISQATGHPNIAGQYVLPFIVLAVLRLGSPGRPPVIRGLILAGLVVIQVFINEELLFLTALALFVFLVAYGFARPRDLAQRVPDALKSLATTALAASAALAYPLYHQFFGRGFYRGLPDFIMSYGADLAGYWSFARRSLSGDPEVAGKLAQGPTEENSFFGWPLLIALLVVVIWLRRDAVVRALAVTGVVFAMLALGAAPKRGGQPFDIIAPWTWLDDLPLFDSVVPTRLALVVTPVVGCVLAIAVARFADTVHRRAEAAARGDSEAEAAVVRGMGIVVLAMVLGPLLPTPLPVADRPYVPPFFTAGMYREHVPAGGVVLGVPPGWTPNQHTMQWQTAADLNFAIFGGYFLAPNPNDPKRVAMFGPAYPPTMTMLREVAEQGAPVPVTAELRAQAVADFRAAGVTTLVLPAHHGQAEQLRFVVDGLAGPGQLIGGMWIWDVRPLTAG